MKQMTILAPPNTVALGWGNPASILKEQPGQPARGTLWKRILVPIDFSDDSLAALQYAVQIAKQHGASLCLAHIVEPAPFLIDMRNVLLARPDEEVVRISQLLISRLARTQIPKEIPAQHFVRIGRVAESVEKLAAELDMDLVVVTSHSSPGLKRRWFGSMADQIVKTSRRTVLVLTPGHGAMPANKPNHTPAQTA